MLKYIFKKFKFFGQKKTPFGFMKNTISIKGDIVNSFGEKWEAEL